MKEAPIKHLEPFDRSLILQGVESGRAWSMIIAKGTGKTEEAPIQTPLRRYPGLPP
jgi:hypothetical protein